MIPLGQGQNAIVFTTLQQLSVEGAAERGGLDGVEQRYKADLNLCEASSVFSCS